MEFNWADPRKNKRVDTVMMAKAEASRVKRLTSIKSTVSNQLNPTVEHKLKTLKKKKTADAEERPSSRLHQRDFDLSTTTSNSSSHSNNHSFYNEFLPQAARPKSIFDGFGVHAAADGLFHPASNIQAFAEHDAKYPAQNDSARSSKAGDSERRLPPLSGKSDRSERLASRSDSRLPTASSSSASSYRSLSSLSGNRSDGDLNAPRRAGIVPSSADRNAMELLEELDDDRDDGDHDDDVEEEPQAPSPVVVKNLKNTTTVSRSEDDNQAHAAAKPSVVPPLELDLAQKFEQLKCLLKTNREKDKAEKKDVAHGPEVEEDATSGPGPVIVKVHKIKKPRDEAATKAKDKKPVKSKPVATEKPPPPDSQISMGATKMTKAKANELRVRSGVSLSDLKEEHRAALAMLQELGGLLGETEPEAKKVASKARLVTQPRGDKAVKSSDSKSSAESSHRLVDKLRSRIPSGRSKTPREELHGQELVNAALDAARSTLSSEPKPEEDDELWNRYAENQEEEEDDDDPSSELYDDEDFEG